MLLASRCKEKEKEDPVSSVQPGPNGNDAGNAAIVVRHEGGDEAMMGGSPIPFVSPANLALLRTHGIPMPVDVQNPENTRLISTTSEMGIAVHENTDEHSGVISAAAQEQYGVGVPIVSSWQPLNRNLHQQVNRSSEQFRRQLAGAVNYADTLENRAARKRQWEGKVQQYQGTARPVQKRRTLPAPDAAASGNGEGSSGGSGGGGGAVVAVVAVVPARQRSRGGRGQGNWQSGRGRGRGRSRGGYGGYGGGYGGYGGGYRGGYNSGWNQPLQMGRGNVGGPGGVVAGAGDQDQTQQMQQQQMQQQQMQQQQMMQQLNQLTQGSQTQGGGATAGQQGDQQNVQGARSGQAGGFPQDGTGGHQDSLGDRMFD
ncbi:hypothetical protein SCUP234_05956 [Seiridium cupressi]